MRKKTVSMFMGLVLGVTTVFSSIGPAVVTVSAAESGVTDSDCTDKSTKEPESDKVVPDANQYKYQKDELAAFCHFGPNTFNEIEWGEHYGDKKPSEIFRLNQKFDAETMVSTLKSAGFSVDVEYDYSDSVEQGNVISQSPSANASASEGDTVTITVSQGKKVSYAKMPNVIGLTEDAAKQAIKDQGLVPSVTYQSTSGTYGLVTAQGYNSGESLESGTTVTIVVSHYQKATEPATTAASQSTTAAVKTTAASGSNTAQ